MTIHPGARLGPYEVVASLGAGGMGEVYRATDTRLNREVAVKVLAPHLAANPALRERFEREARAISALSHPNICALYDVGTTDEHHFLVMELLEGESLADRVAKGPLPLDPLLRYAVQISDALAAAHRQGIVHRDLKPGNVFLTKTGAKLLDFGLAKTASQSQVVEVLTSLPTEHKPLTQEGTILGTFQYMAPEQLEGLDADARTDIFALGCVLYEMATGKRAFSGKNRTSLIASIVSGTPAPITSVQPTSPPALEHVIAKCLEKDPEDRWQSAADVASELRWIMEAGSQAGVAAPIVSRRKNRERALWIAALIAAVAATGFVMNQLRPEVRVSPTFRADLEVNPPIVPGTLSRPFTVSPDGRFVVYSAFHQDVDGLHIRRLDAKRSMQLSGGEVGREPFVSPDGKWIGFRVGEMFFKIPVTGGPPQPLAKDIGWTPKWEEDGYIYFAGDAGIIRIPENGGTPEVVVPKNSDEHDASYGNPSVLPGGKKILFTVGTERTDFISQIAVYDIAKKRREIIRAGVCPRYLSSGHLVYSMGGAVYAARFNPRTLKLESDPVMVVDRVAVHPSTREAFYDTSNAGVLAYIGGDLAWGTAKLFWVDRQGRSEQIPLPARPYAHPRISPDGKSVVVAVRESTTDVWSLSLDRLTLSRLTFEPIENEMPNWFSENRVIFSSQRANDPRSHFLKAADGTGSEEKVFSAKEHQHISSVSPDRKWLLMTEFHPTRATDIWLVSADGKEVRPLIQTKFSEQNAVFSPDGKWIAYMSNESGRPEIYVIGHGTGGKWQVSIDGGRNPLWSPNGRELFYLSGDTMHAVDVTLGASFSASKPKELFSLRAEVLPRGDTNYDISPDGQRFLMVVTDDESGLKPITVVSGWFEELNRLVPEK